MSPLRGSIKLIVHVPWAVAHGYQNVKPTAFFLKCQSRINVHEMNFDLTFYSNTLLIFFIKNENELTAYLKKNLKKDYDFYIKWRKFATLVRLF